MDSKIQELTDKIYREGVEKGNEQAAKIVAEAEAKSAETINNAKAEAERIVSDAKKKATEFQQNTESELKLYAGQMLESLKSTIVNQISGTLSTANVKAATANPEFMQQMMLEMAKSWASGEKIVISTQNAAALKSYFESNAKELLDSKVTIKEVNNQQVAYTIQPQDGSYKIQFGEEEFINLFKSFLRPRLVEMLF